MISWIQEPREEKTQITTLEYTVPYIIICESDTIETQVLFTVIKFGTAKVCFLCLKIKNLNVENKSERVLFCRKLSTILRQTFAVYHSELDIFCN